MSRAHRPPTRVLALIDDSDDQIALATAVELADRHDASVAALVCVEAPHDVTVLARLSGQTPQELIAALKARAEARARGKMQDILPGRRLDLTVVCGKAFVEIIRHVIAVGYDFVVKRAEPRTGVHGVLFASTDQHLLRKCPCPVWLQTDTSGPEPKRVIAAVDVDIDDTSEPETLKSLNRQVIRVACAVASKAGARITVLHAWEALGDGVIWAFSSLDDPRAAADHYADEVRYGRERELDKLLRELDLDDAPLLPRLVRGATEHVIEAQCRSENAEVVVMGTVARTGLSGVFIGNTAENIINRLNCPVIAVKPDGFVSPLATGQSLQRAE